MTDSHRAAFAPAGPPDPQAEALAFLGSPEAFGGAEPVTHLQTHGAHVFLAGEVALKVKRAVRYDYMDLSTRDRRAAMLRRELELNRPAAPGLYRDVVALARGAGGRLALDGPGEPVEWVLRMRRFRAEDELEAVAARGGFSDALATGLGHALAAYHAAAPVRDLPGERLIGDILDELDRVFAGLAPDLPPGRTGPLVGAMRARLAAVAPLLRARSDEGHVRRGHGDLHLRNLVLIDGRPVPFDALEFDERLGTCDLLYDLAFLLMDLVHRGLDRAAAIVLSAWLLDRGGAEDAGLAALPLFLAVRAAIRAMVLAQTDRATGGGRRPGPEALSYLDLAARALAPAAPLLAAVGGVSGTGKSVLARALAPHLGPLPGAVILSSDAARKTSGTAPTYDAGARAAVYADLLARARRILAAGHAAILDATFLDPARRAEARALAEAAGVPFQPLWLTAPEPVLLARVAARRGDPSDADSAVVRAQLAAAPDAADWPHVDASRPPEDTLRSALGAMAQ